MHIIFYDGDLQSTRRSATLCIRSSKPKLTDLLRHKNDINTRQKAAECIDISPAASFEVAMVSGEAYDQLNPTERTTIDECLTNLAELGRLSLLGSQISQQIGRIVERNIALTEALSPEARAVLVAERQQQSPVAGDLPRQRTVEEARGDLRQIHAF